MRKGWVVAGVTLGALCALRVAGAEHGPKLPPGPIHDRHELMEGIGKNAKIIGEALKSGTTTPVAGAAEKIQASAGKITKLFPPGSTDPNSRAKPEIWSNWPKFEADALQLQNAAGALATTAHKGGDVGAAAKTMFGACKSCHDDFRTPDKD